MIGNIYSMIRWCIHSTGTDPVLAQPHNNHGSFDEDFLDDVREELTQQPDNSSNRLRCFVTATEACMRFSAVLPIGRSAITSSSQPMPCSDSNSNSNDITNITSIENMESVNGSTIVESAMSLGAYELCQWLDLGFLLCGILFWVSLIYLKSNTFNGIDGLLKSDLKWVKS